MSLVRNSTTFKEIQGTRRKGKKMAMLKVLILELEQY